MDTTESLPAIGIYGGTFDPIHYGHLRMAEELADIIGLQRVIFVPSGSPRLRAAPAAARMARSEMVRLAIQGNDRFTVDEREINRPGISTTIESLREFRAELGSRVALCFIIGADAFLKIDQWHEWRALFHVCHFVIVSRPGYAPVDSQFISSGDIESEWTQRRIFNADDLKLQPAGYIFTPRTSRLEISASQIRDLAGNGKSLRYLLPEVVADYIRLNSLYIEKV